MEKQSLKTITTVFPFDAKFIKVGKGKKNIKWNLMDADGNLVSPNWFSAISKNADGSIVAKAIVKRVLSEATFLSVNSFVDSAKNFKAVPISFFSLVDTGSLVPCRIRGYVAEATFYGEEVFLDKDGNIYDGNGNKLRVLLNTADGERFYNAIWRFNRKVNYEVSPASASDAKPYTLEAIESHKQSMLGFYFLKEDWYADTSFKNLTIGKNCKKWTDDLIVRVILSTTPESVLAKLKASFGEGTFQEVSNGIKIVSWHFKKTDLDRIVSVLDSI